MKNEVINEKRKTVDIISKEIGSRIRKKRKENGYETMDEFCMELVDYGLDISSSILGNYERGRRTIPLDRLYIILKALKVENITEIFPDKIPWEI